MRICAAFILRQRLWTVGGPWASSHALFGPLYHIPIYTSDGQNRIRGVSGPQETSSQARRLLWLYLASGSLTSFRHVSTVTDPLLGQVATLAISSRSVER